MSCPPYPLFLIENFEAGQELSITISNQNPGETARVALRLLSNENSNAVIHKIIWGDENNRSISVDDIPRHTESSAMLQDSSRTWVLKYCPDGLNLYENDLLIFSFIHFKEIVAVQAELPDFVSDFEDNCRLMDVSISINPTTCSSVVASSSEASSSSQAESKHDWILIITIILLVSGGIGLLSYGLYRLFIA